MDATVNCFLNEINKIAPPKDKKNECAWQECHDEKTGCAYYWNVATNVVTWEMPEEYKLWQESNKKASQNATNLYVPPKTLPLFPSSNVVTEPVKIYRIKDEAQKTVLGNSRESSPKHFNVPMIKESKTISSPLEEPVTLVPSYESDSGLENEEQENASTFQQNKNKLIVEPNLPDETADSKSQQNSEDEDDLLKKIEDKAKILKDLGGDLPPDVKHLVDKGSDKPEKFSKKEKRPMTGFSLIAGYGDSEDEEEEEPKAKTLFPIAFADETGFSTLFSANKSEAKIENNTSISKVVELVEPDLEETVVATKGFQRKKRIDIDIVKPKPAYNKISNSNEDHSKPLHQGLGYKSENKVEYQGFKSGGVLFTKSDTINLPKGDNSIDNDSKSKDGETNDKMLKEINEIQATLNEKLAFLNEGKEPATSVQVIIIQLETLYTAMKAGGLTVSYLHNWLNDTRAELVNLEKDAAPEGWLLQWDRVNKRYYYQNQQNGQSQWEYPDLDVQHDEEAMEICTTPPLSEELSKSNGDEIELVPPPPPKLKDDIPSPPLPPIITVSKESKEESAGAKSGNQDEPLPPGVDSSELLQYLSQNSSGKETSNDGLGVALNAFYSDIAALESTTVPAEVTQQNDTLTTETSSEPPLKKKKKKDRISQGLSMKKKGVSKLVERWKNVQKNYDN